MITEELVGFLKGPVLGGICTVNARNEPWYTRAWAFSAVAGGDTLSIYLSEAMCARALDDLAGKPYLANIAADVTTFNSRQFKGPLIESVLASAAESGFVEGQFALIAPILGQFFGPGAKDGYERFVRTPLRKLTIRVEQMFDQTPGPNAGTRLH